MHRYGVHAEDLIGFTMALDVVEGVGYPGRIIVYNTALPGLRRLMWRARAGDCSSSEPE